MTCNSKNFIIKLFDFSRCNCRIYSYKEEQFIKLLQIKLRQ